jgi:hypothetical protein
VATEAAREVAYFGYGTLGDQLLPQPISLVRAALAGERELVAGPVLLDEAGPVLGRIWSLFDLLRADPSFQREVDSEAELSRFQMRLRDEPLDGNSVTRLREFFSKRATVGLRDTTRWALGSRHPWFGWQRARELIAHCFERWGTENFLCPRVHLFTWDLALDEGQLRAGLQANQRAAGLFADQLERRLSGATVTALGRDALVQLALAALDCHHDHPDFDLEAQGRQGGETTARFFGHALYVLISGATGRQQAPRRNLNLAAHFRHMGVERQLLAPLGPEDREHFYSVLDALIRAYAEQGGIGDGTGLKVAYERLPMVLYTFYRTPGPQPRDAEQVLDSFSLDALREPAHAAHLREHPEVFEKLVVFFVLVLRHYLDTDRVPDLRPEHLVRDFMLLGLWGTNSPNLVVNLYRNEKTGKTRSELRFVGRSQIKAYRPESDRKEEAALARLLASQFGPLLEPSVLRAVGAFLMAAEERLRGSRVQDVGALALARHSLELFREAARMGIKGSLVDLATMLEMLVDNSIDIAQRGLTRLGRDPEPPA